MSAALPHDAVVLAGGRARRFGSDKVLAEVGGRTLLAVAVDAVADARHVVVVGPPRDVEMARDVRRAREEPEFGGPVAALAAGLRVLPADDAPVLLLAADLPRADRLVDALLSAPPVGDARVITDPEGRAQWAASLVRRPALRDALDVLGDPDGVSLRRLFRSLRWESVHAPPGATWDVDAPEDLRRPDE